MLQNLQSRVHLLKGFFGLFKEAEDNGFAEFAIVLTIIHLQNLAEGHNIDRIPKVGQVAVMTVIILRREAAVNSSSPSRSLERRCRVLDDSYLIVSSHDARLYDVREWS